MTIENTIGSQITVNKEQTVHTNITTERPAITREDNRKAETADQRSNVSTYKVTKSELEDAIGKMNDFLSPTRRNLKFELHDKLEKYYVSVVDSSTDEVIKEIPPKKFLDMYAAMAEYMGILVDKKI